MNTFTLFLIKFSITNFLYRKKYLDPHEPSIVVFIGVQLHVERIHPSL